MIMCSSQFPFLPSLPPPPCIPPFSTTNDDTQMDSTSQSMCCSPAKSVLSQLLPETPVCNSTDVTTETLPAKQDHFIDCPESTTKDGNGSVDGGYGEENTAYNKVCLMFCHLKKSLMTAKMSS